MQLESSTVFLTRFAEEASRRLPRISGAAWRITEDLQTLRGTPCYFGKRVHIANVLAATQQGMALDDLQAAWPYLTAQPLDDAEVYIKALPCPERPRRFEEVISQPRVASRGAV